LDEAIALPTDYSAKIARNTQIILQQESGICAVVDPMGGSNLVESLTQQMMDEAMKFIDEIEKEGGMTKAIEAGIPKMRIEEAAAKKQVKIDSGEEFIIGVNSFQSTQKQMELDILDIDNSEVRRKQIERLQQIKKDRNTEAVTEILQKLKESAKSGEGNLLEICIEAARRRVTLGEMSDAMNASKNEYFGKALTLTEKFEEEDGRRPRIMVVKMGQDGHDRGAKVVATAFADMGFDVDVAPLFQTPSEVAKQAVENDIHILGVSSLAAGHKYLIPEVVSELKKLGAEDITIVVGGVIPKQDYDFLYENGADFIFGPGTNLPKSACEILERFFEID
jgi:methylmalonyl-CoA mutase